MGLFQRLTARAVHEAAERIRPHIAETPLIRSEALSRKAGGDVFLKLENRQTTGSFKLRGALNALAALTPAQRSAGIVASSAGNHGLGVAFAAKVLGIRALIFVPRVQRLRGEGGAGAAALAAGAADGAGGGRQGALTPYPPENRKTADPWVRGFMSLPRSPSLELYVLPIGGGH